MDCGCAGRTVDIGFIAVHGMSVPWFDFTETGSTMDEAASMARNGIPGWAVVTARVQCSGRGTRGREWCSFPGSGLWMSVIMPPPKEASRMEGLPLRAAESLAEGVFELTGFRPGIKPPNDLVSRGMKLAGILVESVTSGSTVSSVILGMGVNISPGRAELDAAGLPDATSLFLETGCAPGREELAGAFFRGFIPVYHAIAGVPDSSGDEMS